MRIARRRGIALGLTALVVALLVGAARLAPLREATLRRASLAELEDRARSRPGDLDLLLWLGRKRMAAEQLDKAAAAFRQALALRSSFGPAWIGLGEVLRRRGEDKEALGILSAAVARDPKAAAAHASLALLHERRGEMAEALQAAQRAIDLAPREGVGWFAKGVIHHRMEQAGNTIHCLRNAVRFAPEEARYQHLLGEGLRDLGRLAEAEPPLRRALVLAPDYAETHLSLGQLYAAKSPPAANLPRAVESLTRARELTPRDWAPRYHLGRVYLRQRRFREAIRELDAVVNLAPDYDPVLLELSRAYAGLGDRAKARHWLRSFEMASANYQKTLSLRLRLNHEPDNAALHFDLARLYLERGRNGAAYGELQAGLSLDPKNAWAQATVRRLLRAAEPAGR